MLLPLTVESPRDRYLPPEGLTRVETADRNGNHNAQHH